MTDGMSPADFAAVTGNNNGFGGDNGAWWLIVLFIFAFCGWGNGGFGGGSNGAANNYVLASDFATLQRQIDSGVSSLERKGDTINAGLCDGFYAMNTGLLNGFAGVNNNITQNTIASMQNTNAIQSQLAQCCCDNREAIAQVRFDMATGNCAINNNIQNATRDIIENQTCNTRAIIDTLTQQQMEMYRTKIADQNQYIASLQLAASQQAQNAYLIDQLRTTTAPTT